MKTLLPIFLLASFALAIPAKAEPYDSKLIAGAALTVAGTAGCFLAGKLFHDYNKEKKKNHKEMLENNITHDEFWKRNKKNFIRLSTGIATGFLSFSATTAGLVLLGLGFSKQQAYTLPQMFNKKC